MAETQTPTIDDVARILEISIEEVSRLLKNEFQVIQEDPFEKNRYPPTYADFKTFAIKNIAEISNDSKQILTLKKLIDREGPRKLYFFSNELEGIYRILTAIENANHQILDISNLGLISLPPILKKAKSIEILSISNNNIESIDLIAFLPNLKDLNASFNQITNITPLQKNRNLEALYLNRNNIKTTYEVLQNLPKLRVLELVNNRINDALIKPILMNPSLVEINLNNNPLDCPNTILTDLVKLRAYYNIKIESLGKNISTQTNKNDIKETATIVEPIEKVEEPANITDVNDTTVGKPKTEEKEVKPEEEFKSQRTGSISIMATPEKVLLDAEKLSKIFYDFIAECQYNSEQFFGLFGRWGRGKTYLWDYLKDHDLNKELFIPIEFHAWKYQDTPGLWAYLYSELNKKYFENSKGKKTGLAAWFAKVFALLKLNKVRSKVVKPTLIFLLGIIISTIVFLIIKTNTQWLEKSYVFIPSLIGLVGINLIAIVNYLEKYRDGAKQLVSQITSNINFKSQLGLQHEIQEELKYLLKAWIPKKSKAKKRILLFIDDIDRCSEDKIIQIVDYIRVLLNDKEIQSRVTVLAAIDERILIHAIQNKYRKFVENKNNDATFKELCREYMDKLFLAGLKLGPLTGFEKEEMVDGFTQGYLNKETKGKVDIQITKSEVVEPSIDQQEVRIFGKDGRSLDPGKLPSQRMLQGAFEKASDSDLDTKPKVQSDAEGTLEKDLIVTYSLEPWEQKFLKEIMKQYCKLPQNSTI